MRRGHKVGIGLGLLTAVLFLSGCVYLRLLDVKGQLAKFDEHCEVTVDARGMLIEFRDPTLKLDDMEFLGVVPISRDEVGDSRYWDVVMSKRYKGKNVEGDRFDLRTTLGFEDGRLSSVLIPAAYLEAFPAKLISSTIEALGEAKVFKLKKSVAAEAAYRPNVSKKKIREIFGTPYKTRTAEGLEYITYSYRKKVPEGHPDENDEDKIYSITYIFDQESAALVSAKTKSIRIDYL